MGILAFVLYMIVRRQPMNKKYVDGSVGAMLRMMVRGGGGVYL